MLRQILLIAFLGICYGSVFEHSLKFSPLRKQVHRFTMDIPRQERNSKQPEMDENKENLVQKIENALLLRGQPMGGLSPNSLLPLFGLKRPTEQAASNGHPPLMDGFSINNCSDKAAREAVFVIEELLLKPDPVVLPGTLSIKFNIRLLDEIKALNITLDLLKRIGSTYIRIPCLGQFGSCSYKVCEMLESVQTCPPELVKHGIPCKCPFAKGAYKEPGISATIGAELFAVGDYNVTAMMTSEGKFVGCYKATFTIRS